MDDRPSGLGICTINIVRELCMIASGNDKVAIFTSYPAYFKDCGADIRDVSELVQPKHGKFAGIVRFLWTQLIYPARLRKEKYGVIYNTTHHAVFLTATPQIMTIQDLIPIKFPSRDKLQYFYFRFIIPILIDKCRLVITVSENSKKDIVEYYNIPTEKIAVVYNSYDREIFKAVSSYDKNHSSAVDPYILVVGASYLNKNIERLLDAYSQIKDKINCKLVIAGGRRQYVRILKKKTNDLNLGHRVTFLDYIKNEELPQLYSNAAVLVFPSIYEGFGIPPLEAMACGCPVVASNVSSIPEVCGDAVFYVDPYSVESIARGMYTILTDTRLRNDLVAKGFEQVKRFSWGESARKVFNIIKGNRI